MQIVAFPLFGDVISEREKLFLQTPQSLAPVFNVDVRVDKSISIDSKNKSIKIRKSMVEYKENYDKLLLSPGGFSFFTSYRWNQFGRIITLRNVADTDAIKNYILSHNIKKAVIVGAGFIGLEMAENLHHLGAEVSIVEKLDQVMAPIDFSMAAIIHEHLLLKGVNLYLGKSVTAFNRNDNKIEITLDNNETLTGDIVILSIGVRPETKLAIDSGLKIGDTKGIWVNEFLQTSHNDIYAVGDAIEFPHPITGKPWLNYLANPANRQGRLVADNMVLGNKEKYEGAIGTSIAKVFDMTVLLRDFPLNTCLA